MRRFAAGLTVKFAVRYDDFFVQDSLKKEALWERMR